MNKKKRLAMVPYLASKAVPSPWYLSSVHFWRRINDARNVATRNGDKARI
jgi:hypothetical protein